MDATVPANVWTNVALPQLKVHSTTRVKEVYLRQHLFRNFFFGCFPLTASGCAIIHLLGRPEARPTGLPQKPGV